MHTTSDLSEEQLACIIEDLRAECTPDDLFPEPYDYYGLPVYQIDGAEYAIATDSEQAEEAAGEYIMQSLWAFNPEFIANYTALTPKQWEHCRGDQCEDFNDIAEALLTSSEYLKQDAIAADGIGHFLSTYDGFEVEAGGCLLYRIN